MAINQIQNTFTMGELDPLLLAKTDFDGYYKGARKLRNVTALPQGGIKQRFGTLYINTVLDPVTMQYITNEDYISFVMFQQTINNSFLIVIRPDNISMPISTSDPTAIDIYQNGFIVATLNAGDGVPWTVGQVNDIRYVRAPDRIVFLHNDVIPQDVLVSSDLTTWSITPESFLYFPTFDFSSRGLAPSYSGPTVTFTPGAASGSVTITVANATPLTSNHVGGLFSGNGGLGRITAVASTTSFTVTTLLPFANTNAIAGDLALLKEPLWGNGGGAVGTNPARGWPSVGTIFQNRMIFANTTVLPNILSASNTFDYVNFDDSSTLDSGGFSYLLGSDSLNEIVNMVSSTTLVVLTSNSVFATSNLIDLPITPANAFLTEQSRTGSNRVQAQVVDNQILFVDVNGITVRSIQFDIIESRITVQNASLLSPHLIRDPREAAIFNNPFKSEGNYYFVVNADDGSIAVFQSLEDQNIKAWSLATTQGQFLDICADKNECYVLVARQISQPGAQGPNTVVLKATPDFTQFTDITDDSNDTAIPISIFDYGPPTENQYVVIGNTCPFTNIQFLLNTVASAPMDLTIEYYSKTQVWTPIRLSGDTTLGLTQNGFFSWVYPNVINWAPNEVNEIENLFWIRIQNNSTNIATLPIQQEMFTNLQQCINIEQIRFDFIPDCCYEATSDEFGVIAELDGLAGRQVWLLEQTSKTYDVHAGVCFGPYFCLEGVVTTNPSHNLANQSFVVGIFSAPRIVPMPPVAQTQLGSQVYLPRYVQSLFIDYYESAGIIVANREIPILAVDGLSMNIPLNLKTGFWEISPYPDRNPRNEIEITTVQPLPFTIIGLGYKVQI